MSDNETREERRRLDREEYLRTSREGKGVRQAAVDDVEQRWLSGKIDYGLDVEGLIADLGRGR